MEELFHIGNDRLEMKNLVKRPDHSGKLKEMQRIYDEHFQHLKKHAVDFNGYGKYRILFDRHISWDRKQPLLNRKK